MSEVNNRTETEIGKMKSIIANKGDGPVLMLNLNLYTDKADFPNGDLYQRYMTILENFLPAVGACVLWRQPVLGQPTGTQKIHEVLAAWYPSHQAFIDLPTAPGAEENFSLRAMTVAEAVIHRCPANSYPFIRENSTNGS